MMLSRRISFRGSFTVARFGRKMGKKFHTIEKKTQKILQEYVWPGGSGC
jgi:transcriptional regulator with PAS, ATPase and Fis domain